MGPWESLPRCSKIHKKCAIKKFVKSFFTKKNLPFDETIYTVQYHSLSLLGFEHIFYCTVLFFIFGALWTWSPIWVK